MTSCTDAGLHRSRVEGRQRLIPDWYELDWVPVARSRESWQPPDDVDLVVEAGVALELNVGRLRALLLSAAQ
jgi:hypothetical protein